MIVISSAELAKEVLKTQDLVFCSRPSIRGQQKLAYNDHDIGFAPYNYRWRELRKICVLHLFSLKKVQSFSPIREDEVSRMIKKISQQAATSKITNLSNLMISLTSTIICRVAFGVRFDEEAHQRKRFDYLLAEAQAMTTSFFVSDFFPSLNWIDKLKLIEQHQNPNRPKSMEGDILNILLQLKKEQSTPIDLSLDDIKGVLMNVFVAGSDTSAAAVVWVMTALIKNPKVMKKVQEEIRKTIGNKGIVNEDDIQNILYPPATLLIPRESMEKSTLEGYEIPPRTIVHVNTWAIARDPEIWENPEEFMPERFLNNDIDFKGQNYELIPFGAGRRGCPGMTLGVVSMELALSNLLYAFDWELPNGLRKEDIDTDVRPGTTMHKKNELCLIPIKYSQN
ncbi:unnamed protein product [Withania somnifera]